MLSVRRVAHWVGVVSAFALMTISLVAAPKAQAAGFLDFLFNRNAEESINDHISAGDKSLTGANSLDASVSNTNTSFFDDMLLRLQGPPQSGGRDMDRSTTDAEMQRKYGRGAIGDVAGAIRYLYQPPASTHTYVADLLNDAHIVPKAQAQGLGFAALDPILETWKMFRNLAYLLYVLVFLVIGFMVMFKAQMGKAAVTLQSALPNIVVSLIFVTFSYAIAGFLIDIMYVFMYLLVGMFPTAGGSEIMNYNFLQLGWTIIMGDGQNTGAFRSFAEAVDKFVSASITFSDTAEDNTWYGAISGVTMALIMSVAILVGVFKLFFELLKTYVTVVLYIAFAPLILMIGAIPGQDVFQSWLRDVIGNLMAFPTTLLIIIVFRMFTNSTQQGGGGFDNVGGFLPPFLIGQGSGGAVTTLVGVGIILIMPELIREMKKALGVKDGLFTVLAKDMAKNFVKDGVYHAATPMAVPGAVAGSMIGSGLKYAIPAIKRGTFDMPAMWRSMRRGEMVDGKETGGWKGGIKNAQSIGKSIKVGADRIMSGSFLDPENTDKLLSNIASQRDGKHTPHASPGAGRAKTTSS